MARALCLSVLFTVLAISAIENWPGSPAIAAPAGDGPEFTADGKLVRPTHYRKWVFLSSG